MSLRKFAGLLVVGGLAVGLIGGGVGAQFTDQVKADQNISVGTFGCDIVAVNGATVDPVKSVTYDAPTILNSAPGQLPFNFTVKNTGTIPALITVTPTLLSSPWSVMGTLPLAQPLAAGALYPVSTGVAWTVLSNADLGGAGSVVWTVSCVDHS
jgi:predicted ribosomally synthesized peptide with SipW-like signal peptide